MAKYSTGIWLVHSSSTITSSSEVSGTNGTDYVQLSGSPRCDGTIQGTATVRSLPGGTHYTLGLAKETENIVLHDVVTLAQHKLIKAFFRKNMMISRAGNVYLVVVIDGNGTDAPTVYETFYDSTATEKTVLRVRLDAGSYSYRLEKNLTTYQITVNVSGWWST